VPPGAVRLIGVRTEQLVFAAETGEQLMLDAPDRGWRDADIAADAARSKFGRAAIGPASLLHAKPRAADPE
jgi:DNA polymerase-4